MVNKGRKRTFDFNKEKFTFLTTFYLTEDVSSYKSLVKARKLKYSNWDFLFLVICSKIKTEKLLFCKDNRFCNEH